MSDFKVLFIYPNQRTESLVPPAIAILTRLLRDRGVKVAMFDSTHYDLDADDYIDTTFLRSTNRQDNKGAVQNLLVRPYESRAESLRKHMDATTGLELVMQEFQPDLLAVTVTESTFLLATHLLRVTRPFGVPNIVGGVFPTFAPERALGFPEVDMVCVGEGENCLVDLCEEMQGGRDYSKVTNLWFKDKDGSMVKNPVSRPVDVDEIPMPDYSLFEDGQFYRPMYGSMYKMIPVETHRGCPYTCAFCNSPSQNRFYAQETNSAFFRKRSLDRVRDDLVFFRDEMGMEYIYFWADTFFAWSPSEFDAFVEMYSDVKLPFWCQTRVETVTEEKISKLQDVGLHFMTFGMEHGNEQFRAEVVKRKYPNDLAIEALAIPKGLGVPFAVNNIIGFPDETRELAMDTVEINRHFQPDQMSCSILQPYCGTELRPRCVSKGYLHPDTICPANSENTVMTLPTFTPEELIGLKRTFAMYVRFPKDRWPEIEQAEKLTPEGDEVWARLSGEYRSTYLQTDDSDITRQGDPMLEQASDPA